MTDTRVTRTLCNCGHVAESDGFTTGYGETREGYRLCFACCGEDETNMLPFRLDPYVGYLSADNRRVTGWVGNTLMHVTGVSESKAARKMYVKAVDATGAHWFGVGPRESGTYVTMRRYKGMGGRNA